MDMMIGPATPLERKCRDLRRSTLEMIAESGTGHPGSSLSCMELLVCLYYRVMAYEPSDLGWRDRDRLVLSKGHAAPALYAILIDLGILPPDEKWRLRQIGSMLQGHPDSRFTPGVEVSTGSLGQGLSVAAGMALGAQRRNSPSRTFVILGDGESQEGQVWEAALVASSLQLDNLCAITDFNRIQHDGRLDEIVGMQPLLDKWQSFGWDTQEVDGHDVDAIVDALQRPLVPGKPRMLIAHTIKGKGVDYMEDDWHWHSVADAARLARDFGRGAGTDA